MTTAHPFHRPPNRPGHPQSRSLRAAAAVLTLCFGTLLAALLPTAAARAQALPTAKGPGSRLELGVGISGFQQPYGQQHVAGYTVYVDLYPHWRYGITTEARFLNRNTQQDVILANYMGGLKFAIRPRPSRIEPYAKMLIGKGHIDFPYGYATGDFLAYAPGGGVDVSVGDYIRLRTDFEYQRWNNFPFGNFHPYGITTGVVFRLNPLHRYPEGDPRHNGIPR